MLMSSSMGFRLRYGLGMQPENGVSVVGYEYPTYVFRLQNG
ncbi:hypothetical protein [Kingella negevensis]|nr:hypothetical protein [Kingella negevensis]MDK4679233.1 hypothetical protein [Kingella negevensis]MDK4683045.1 hypothetical protein [Kingella negevensis]MDK4683766.1 hypothetical protein [Kingella negevensis]MDK4688475.1 hypothetical protein [Kingella negevensis]MDK4691245.1 hypothetical protein [Kingella negevensis]